MDFSKFMNAPKTVAGNPAPPIPPTVEKNLPYFSYFSQVVQPLVFDNSLSFYEVCTRLAAAVNNNILQINQLTGAMKEFMEYMVKWGTELNAEWEEYKTDLTGKWEAYQAELNRQWSEYKNNLNEDWNNFQTNYYKEWTEFKNSIESTIESLTNNWLVENVPNILQNMGIPGWVESTVSLNDVIHTNINIGLFTINMFLSKSLDLLYILLVFYGTTQQNASTELDINTKLNVKSRNEEITTNGAPTNALMLVENSQNVTYSNIPITAKQINNELHLKTGAHTQEINTTWYTTTSILILLVH